jgi:hypothetical protein
MAWRSSGTTNDEMVDKLKSKKYVNSVKDFQDLFFCVSQFICTTFELVKGRSALQVGYWSNSDALDPVYGAMVPLFYLLAMLLPSCS